MLLLASAKPLALSALPTVASADHREKKPSSASLGELKFTPHPVVGLRSLSQHPELTFRVGFKRTTFRAAGTTIRFFCKGRRGD